jgi:hypothetical protein
MRTAYCRGTIIVSAKVATRTIFCTSPVRHTERIFATLIVRYPMSMSSPASAGMAM